MAEKSGWSFEKLFGVGKESFKICAKYGLILGVAQFALALLNGVIFAWLGLFENNAPINFVNGPRVDPATLIILVVTLAVIGFVVTFVGVFFGLKKILQLFPKESKASSAIHIFGISLIVFIVLASLNALQLTRPQGLLTQTLAVALAFMLAKPQTSPIEVK